jgi:hypothetical protein
MHEAVLQQARRDGAVTVAPPYSETCECPRCSQPATHTVVLHLWATDDIPAFRGLHNSVRMYPSVAACDGHKKYLHEIGLRMLEKCIAHARDLFKALSKEAPDLKDVMIDVRTIDEAMKLWLEPTKH